MENIFIKLLNMSISASWLVLAIILLRVLLKKAPKWTRCFLWALVAVRLICPVSVESIFSLIPSAEAISRDIAYAEEPAPTVGDSVNPLQIILAAATAIWVAVIVVMLIYAVVSYVRIKRKVGASLHLKDNMYLCDYIRTPFILGVIRPRICLPSALGEEEMAYVIAHEKAHLRRLDHWWKPLGYLLLSVYWFNPVIWVAYILLCRDIELAYDESVIRGLGEYDKKPYSDALLSCSIPRRMITACPLAFGEVGVKDRIKAVLNYRKPAFYITVLAVVSCMAVAVCFLTNPIDNEPDLSFLNYENAISIVADAEEVMAIYCPPSDEGSGASIQVGAATGTELAKQLDRWEWKECNAPR